MIVITGRCITTESASKSGLIYSTCIPYLTTEYIFDLPDYSSLNEILRLLETATISFNIDDGCTEEIQAYICNYIFVGCDANLTIPIGICQNDCESLLLQDNTCSNEVNTLFILASTVNFEFTRQCNRTHLPIGTDASAFTFNSSTCISTSGELVYC